MGLIINPYSFSTGGGGIVYWGPADLPDLAGWWDADEQTESDGATVSNFVNRQGNSAFDFLSVGTGPTLRYNRVNSKKALEFNGNALEIASTNDFLEGVSACSLCMVVKGAADPQSSPTDEAPLNGFGTGGVSHFFTDGNWYESFGTNSRRSVNPPTSWASSFRIAAVLSGSNDFRMYWDGTAIVTETSNTVATGTGNRRMGDREGGGAGTYAGDIAEVIICDAVLSTTDRQKLEGYLAHKYGLAGNLPVGHPYISGPPSNAPSISYASQDVSTSTGNSVSPSFNAGASPVFTLEAGSLPPGMSLNASTGEITGQASSAGTYSGIQIKVTAESLSATSAAFTLTSKAGYRYYFIEFVSSTNNFLGCTTIKLLDGSAVDRALQSNGAVATAVGYTVNGSFPVTLINDGDDSTWTTSAGASAGSGKGFLIDMGAIHDIDKVGYRSRTDGFGANEAITSGNVKAGMTGVVGSMTQLYAITEAGWSANEYREWTMP